MNKWSYEQIVSWHIKTFPDATFEKQLLKLDEEIGEFASADEENMHKELADVFIVCVVLTYRYNSHIGASTLEEILEYDDFDKVYLYREVSNKMEINAKRTWVKDSNGVYRHVG